MSSHRNSSSHIGIPIDSSPVPASPLVNQPANTSSSSATWLHAQQSSEQRHASTSSLPQPQTQVHGRKHSENRYSTPALDAHSTMATTRSGASIGMHSIPDRDEYTRANGSQQHDFATPLHQHEHRFERDHARNVENGGGTGDDDDDDSTSTYKHHSTHWNSWWRQSKKTLQQLTGTASSASATQTPLATRRMTTPALSGQHPRASSTSRNKRQYDHTLSGRMLAAWTSLATAFTGHTRAAPSSPLMAPSSPLALSMKRKGKRRGMWKSLGKPGWSVVAILLLLGLRELFSSSGPAANINPAQNMKISGRDPFLVLESLGKSRTKRSRQTSLVVRPLPGADSLWKRKIDLVNSKTDHTVYLYANEDERNARSRVVLEGEAPRDVTAIVLHWKRTDNVVVIVASLCQYTFFDTVVVWNNNPDIHLTREMFKASRCPASRLRIYNSPRNMLFVARYLACAQASTPHCFFQDDDWLVQPIRALYSQFSRDPEGPVVVHTNPQVAALYGLEWCFFESSLHTCFAWVGTGAFASKRRVRRYLETITALGFDRDLIGHADNAFTTFQNQPPYVMSSSLMQLPSPFGHSDGAGIARNKAFIYQGLGNFSAHVGFKTPSWADITILPTVPDFVDVTRFKQTPLPPLEPHPYAHHARSPCLSDTCTFLTNINLLPPPDSVPFPGTTKVANLESWENRVGWVARGWIEGGEMFNEEETWALKWPYAHAVDDDERTAFRSPDIIRMNDYIGLSLLAPIDAHWIPRVSVTVMLENHAAVLENVAYEVSFDGYKWHPAQQVFGPVCSGTSVSSTMPDSPFPLSRVLSSVESRLANNRELQLAGHNLLSRYLRRRQRRQTNISVCRIEMGSRAVMTGDQGQDVRGWKFVRLRAKRDDEGGVGWGVYELRVDATRS
ncbi:hypothetical protein OIV83_004455 [Microbotryomycetes sp. JL201]|nr:hypothetical protein OIV83_004455 [Microbotryomycetes sp. JL201]